MRRGSKHAPSDEGSARWYHQGDDHHCSGAGWEGLCCPSEGAKDAAGPLHISLDDLEGANKGFEPASCWGVGRVQSGEGPGPRGWQDVGGLGEVREALQEAMELPTKYAALIARCGSELASCHCSQPQALRQHACA